MTQEITKHKVLLAEDDSNAAFMLSENLSKNGYKVTLAMDGKQAITAINTNEFDLALLDVMMPKKDGIELTKYIKSHYENLPVVLITARNLLEDRVTGFKSGCDDYVTKPFYMEELILRLEAVMRRSSIYHKPLKTFSFAGVDFDINQNLIHKGEETIPLTPKESKILELFLLHFDRTLPREFLLEKVWGASNLYTSRTFDVYLSRIRKILRQLGSFEILNTHSLGFRMKTLD